MKKILAIVVLSLLWCNVGFAKWKVNKPYQVFKTSDELAENIKFYQSSKNMSLCKKNRDNASEYDISGHYTIWVSKDFRINHKPPLIGGNISLKITSSDLNSNIYTLLYNELKTKYTSTTDEL